MSEETTNSDILKLGMKTRKEVLGSDYVDSAVAASTEFDEDFQQLITASAWGLLWGRDTFSKRDRSLITVSLLASLGHHEELALHLKATVNTGLSRDDIKEALLHVAIYAGIPAANSAFKVAKTVFAEADQVATSENRE